MLNVFQDITFVAMVAMKNFFWLLTDGAGSRKQSVTNYLVKAVFP